MEKVSADSRGRLHRIGKQTSFCFEHVDHPVETHGGEVISRRRVSNQEVPRHGSTTPAQFEDTDYSSPDGLSSRSTSRSSPPPPKL